MPQTLQENMVTEANIILSSVDWYERKIDQKLLEIEQKLSYNSIEILRRELLSLLAALKREERNMDEYMAKYRKLVHEENKRLYHLSKKHPPCLRGVSTNITRSKSGEGIQKGTKA